SGGTSGLSVGHISPEAAGGGAIALAHDGDAIVIDIPRRGLRLGVPGGGLAGRGASLLGPLGADPPGPPPRSGSAGPPGEPAARPVGVHRRGAGHLRARAARLAADVTAGFVRQARAPDAAGLARIQVASWRASLAGLLPEAVLAELTSTEAERLWAGRWLEAIHQ